MKQVFRGLPNLWGGLADLREGLAPAPPPRASVATGLVGY